MKVPSAGTDAPLTRSARISCRFRAASFEFTNVIRFSYCGLTQRVLANISQAESHSGIDESNRKDWKYLTFIRDPVDRFLSAYVEKCIG